LRRSDAHRPNSAPGRLLQEVTIIVPFIDGWMPQW
jgi:hypothetical protein